MGGGALVLQSSQLPPDPCTQDDRSFQAGPGALTYTSAPMKSNTVLAGPVDATIYATSNRAETELVATLEDVAPNGASLPLTGGALLGSFRKLDDGLTWLAPDGRPLLPYHPYTRESVVAVPTGKVTRYDIEIFPTVAQIAGGHQLRLTLTTSDMPHLLPTRTQAADLAGGVYNVQRNRGAASFLELPLVAAQDFPRPVTAVRRPGRACPRGSRRSASCRRTTRSRSRGCRRSRRSARRASRRSGSAASGCRRRSSR